MAWPPADYPLAADKTNQTSQVNDHPGHHNQLAASVNDLVAQLQAEQARITSAEAAHSQLSASVDTRVADLQAQINGKASTSTTSSLQSQVNARATITTTDALDSRLDAVEVHAKQVKGWTNIGTVNGWATLATDRQQAQYRKIGDRVDVRFELKNGSVDSAGRSDWFTFPSGYRPPKGITVPVALVYSTAFDRVQNIVQDTGFGEYLSYTAPATNDTAWNAGRRGALNGTPRLYIASSGASEFFSLVATSIDHVGAAFSFFTS